MIQKEVHGNTPNFLFFTKPVLNGILKSECVKSWKFWHSLGKELTVMTIPPLKIIVYSAITCLILKISQFSSPTKITLNSAVNMNSIVGEKYGISPEEIEKRPLSQ